MQNILLFIRERCINTIRFFCDSKNGIISWKNNKSRPLNYMIDWIQKNQRSIIGKLSVDMETPL